MSLLIRKIVGCACAGNAGNVFPATDFKGKRQLAIPACITARALRTCHDACRDRYLAVAGKTFPAFPAHAQPALLLIWQEAHSTWFNSFGPIGPASTCYQKWVMAAADDENVVNLLTSPLDKMAAFCRRHFQIHFREWKVLCFDSNFTEVYS